MLRLLLRRILTVPITLLVVFTAVFVVAHLSPGSPWQADLPVPEAVKASLRARYHADDPLLVQYARALTDIALRGDLGFSYRGSMPAVSTMIAASLPVSVSLAFGAMVSAVAIGIPLGITMGIRPGGSVDHILSGVLLVLLSVPAFVSAPLLILLFSILLHWLPSAGWQGLGSETAIIPVVALAIAPTARIARYTRASVMSTFGQDFVRGLRARGLPEGRILAAHVLPNSLSPVVTVIADDLSRLVASSFFVEAIYGIPGVGRLLVDAVGARDYPVIIGVSLALAGLISLLNLLADVAYACIDPRVSYG
jgi:ABC-type dipeptide/oligopeptide/nickel transport system permease component